MLDPTQLFTFEMDGVTSVEDMRGSVLVLALGGFVDAGHTQRLAANQLLTAHESRVVASFDVDQLLDYRGRRPMMVFDRDRWSSYEDPSLLLHRVIDSDGVPFLLLVGPEPDYQWARMTEAVLRLEAMLGVELTVSLHGIPMAVPHTRPLGSTAHATDPRLVPALNEAFGTVQVPASLSALIELRLGEAGKDAIGFSVHVPHYLAQNEYHAAALLALEQVSAATGLGLHTAELAEAAAEERDEISRQVQDSEEIASVVRALEQQYDLFLEGRKQRSLLATDLSDLPTADEIGAEFEAFLRDVNDPDADPDPDPDAGTDSPS